MGWKCSWKGGEKAVTESGHGKDEAQRSVVLLPFLLGPLSVAAFLSSLKSSSLTADRSDMQFPPNDLVVVALTGATLVVGIVLAVMGETIDRHRRLMELVCNARRLRRPRRHR
jgi:hypothetical protein